jgi:hypothetical protein
MQKSARKWIYHEMITCAAQRQGVIEQKNPAVVEKGNCSRQRHARHWEQA